MTRPVIWFALALAVLGIPDQSAAQSLRKSGRVGFLAPGSAADSSAMIAAFRQGLREAGYVEGQNLAIEWRWAEGRTDRLPDLARGLMTPTPDVLVALELTILRALRIAAPATPIVAAGVDVREHGYVVSLARPGGNVTGLTALDQELELKRMGMLKQILPGLTRVVVLRDLTGYRPRLTAGSTVERWGLTFIPVSVNSSEEFEAAFASATKERVGALTLAPTGLFSSNRRRIADLALKHRLAWIAPDREYAEAGSLMSYGPDRNDLVRRSASYVARILNGAKPADLPIEQPTKFELVANLRTAKALGVTIPQSVLLLADDVIR
jgi:putative tryptophan/tyrosine transport system substrate-binding protein